MTILPNPYDDPDYDGTQDDGDDAFVHSLVELSTTRTGKEAVEWAFGQITSRDQDWYRYCQKFVRSSFNVGSGYASAGEQWDHAEFRHLTSDPASIPGGVAVFWETSSDADHVALSRFVTARCISTDVERTGWPDECGMDDITNGWGATLLGWTEDLNGVRVYRASEPPTKTTPHITEAILRNRRAARRLRAYEIELGRISNPGLDAEDIARWIKRSEAERERLRHQRAVLRAKEVRP